jgi:hypothetical protein
MLGYWLMMGLIGLLALIGIISYFREHLRSDARQGGKHAPHSPAS